MDRDTRKKLIDAYKDGYRVVADALAGAADEELDASPAPGKWTAREIVHHLADSEMNAAMRLRLLLAEDKPAIKGIDQDEFARKLYYDRPHESSLEAFRWARQTTAELLERMGPAEWLRQGTHSEIGRFGVEEWLRIYAPHAHSHARQIREARSAVTK